MPSFDTSPSPGTGPLFDELRAAWEDEVLECKRAENSYDTDRLGKYFSALSKEAALRDRERAWMLLGIDDRSRSVVGTRAFDRPGKCHELKQRVAEHTSTRSTFRDIHELQHLDGRVLMLEVPSAPCGHAVSWGSHHYGCSGEPPGPLPLDKRDDLMCSPCSATRSPLNRNETRSTTSSPSCAAQGRSPTPDPGTTPVGSSFDTARPESSAYAAI